MLGPVIHAEVGDTVEVVLRNRTPIIVTRKGMARPDGTPRDVDRELVANFMVVDENQSPYLRRNLRDLSRRGRGIDVEDEGFVESNLLHAINGFVYGNGPGFDAPAGARVRWYLMGMGTEVDLHTFDIRAEQDPEGRGVALVRHPDGARVDDASSGDRPVELTVRVPADDHRRCDALEHRAQPLGAREDRDHSLSLRGEPWQKQTGPSPRTSSVTVGR